MNTIVVWLMVATYYYYGAHTVTVDNIASRQNCVAVALSVVNHWQYNSTGKTSSMCIAVRKAVPK